MTCGVCFVSTGGNKMVRALRSLRLGEPDLFVHIAMSTCSKVWSGNNAQVPSSYFEHQPNVALRHTTSAGYINGCFNEAIKWMRELGYTHTMLLHDDVVFSPLPETQHHLTKWIAALESDPILQQSSALTLSFMEALVTPPPEDLGRWHRPPDWWDQQELESIDIWRKLLPNGTPALYFGSEGSSEGIRFPDWFVKYFVTERITTMSRLGPCGYILPIATWEAIGGFDEGNGIFYDMEYPVICAMRGLPPVRVIPNLPFIHLHNQSTIGDPAVGIWERDYHSFVAKYGKDPASVLWDQPNGGGY